MNIYITGIGIISAIGSNAAETYASLINEKTGIKKTFFSNLNAGYFAGSIKKNNTELAAISQFNNPNVSRTSLLGLIAAKECWKNNTHHSNLKTGLISATSVGGIDKSEKNYYEVLKHNRTDLADFKYHDSGTTTEVIANELKISGYVNTISTACSSSSNSIMLGAKLIKAGILDRVIVGGSDALTGFTISGFNSLMIYNPGWCSPFDENRQGLNLGEGAAFLMLESDKSLNITGNKVLAKLSGYNNSADAYHQTATSPNAVGATKAMKNALANAKLSPSDISYINAHGTGTVNNDLTESIAIKNVFGKNIPPFSSTKSYTGHTLAASGAIEAVFSVLALNHQLILPNLNFKTPIKETNLMPVTTIRKNENLNHIVSNAFGFSGNCTTLIFSKV